jgi:uncharacterized Zn finger protein (UPF0148 family)
MGKFVVGGILLGLVLFFVVVIRPYMQKETCPYCAGKGFVMKGIIEIPCPICKSAGTIPPYAREKVLKIMQKEKDEAEAERKKAEEAYNSQPAYGQ